MELDLFSTPTPLTAPKPRVWSIGEITRSIRSCLEEKWGDIWVEGEICNFRKQSSGHCYFGLKDERAVLSCVLFRTVVPARLVLADGMLVQARGRLTVYEARGQYQLNVSLVQPAGAGMLQARFEALKRKLDDEGLFDPARKRPIPRDPASIGLVTSPTGAAIRDFLNIARRRAPWVRIVLNPVRVQGAGAANEIAAAIQDFNSPALRDEIDLLVVCRGGGSMEDLWAFNEEIVARAIAASAIPVISAIGHEIDFTIADFVADLRAPTPSAAAELALPDKAALLRHLTHGRTRLQRAMDNMLAGRRGRLDALLRSTLFRFPQRLLAERLQRLDSAAAAMESRLDESMRKRREKLAALHAMLRQHRPDQVLAMRRLALDAAGRKLGAAMDAAFARKATRLAHDTGLLRVLSPEATLERGYSITFDSHGAVVRDSAAVRAGDRIRTRLKSGQVDSRVLE